MSKAPFYPGWLFHIKDTHTRSAADRDRPSSADVPATSLSLSPITKTWISFQRLAQSSIQTLPVTGAHLACRWTEMEKKESQCFSTFAWESLGIPGFFTSFCSGLGAGGRGEAASQKVANGFIQSMRLGYCKSVCERPPIHKSQEIQESHSHTH